LDNAFLPTSQARLPSTISLLLDFLAAAVPVFALSGKPCRRFFVSQSVPVVGSWSGSSIQQSLPVFSFWFFSVRLRFSVSESPP
jgi:hypothetical protein